MLQQSNHRNSVVIFLGLLVLAGVFGYVRFSSENPDRPTAAIQQVPIGANDVNLVPHNPIVIGCDANFTAANGVVGGSGTSSDPFVIEGWEIQDDRSSRAGIKIGNTTRHFLIRQCSFRAENFVIIRVAMSIRNTSNFIIQNCSILDEIRSLVGISLYNVTDFSVEHTICYETNRGIDIEDAQRGTVDGLTFTNNDRCIDIYNANYLTIWRNVGMCPFYEGYIGIVLSNSFNCSILQNQIVGPLDEAIYISGESFLIDGNNCSGIKTGILASPSSYSNITNNTISRATTGIRLSITSNANNISYNRISDSKVCILDDGTNSVKKGNICQKVKEDVPGVSLFWITSMIAVGALLVLVKRHHSFSNQFTNQTNGRK